MAKTNSKVEAKFVGTGKDRKLQITMPVETELTPSASGKTLCVATTHGNIQTELELNGKTVVVGVNAYIYATDKA